MSTSPDTSPEREMLLKLVLPEIRREAKERGVYVVESDPRWEASMDSGRAREIIATRLEELHGYRPIFIGILGNNPGISLSDMPGESPMPWLQDMSNEDEVRLAIGFIEGVMENQLMHERAFFYITEFPSSPAPVEEGSADIVADIERLRTIVRSGVFPARDGINALESLGKQILDDLLAVLDRFHPSEENLSLLERLRRPHELFAANHLRAYVEPPEYFNRLDEHAAGDGVPLFITGGAGTGKSALLANWLAYYRKEYPEVPVISLYTGALAAESTYDSLLRHILAELREICGITESIPDNTPTLITTLSLWLEKLRDKRVLLVIDGLDHLDPASRELDWLPFDIPSNLRLILSVGIEENIDQSSHAKEIFDHLIDRGWEEYPMKPLTLAQQRGIIDRMVEDTGVDLRDDSGSDPLQRFTFDGTASTPLFLRMSVRQLQKTQTLKDRNTVLATRTHQEFFERIFEQLENNHDRRLVGEVMSLIWASRTGMHETELRQLTGADAVALSNFLRAIDHYLVNRRDILTFVHEHVRQAVEQRYLPEQKEQRKIHQRLANYFASTPYSLRRAGEEPWQWKQAGKRTALAACLADIEMFRLLSTEDQLHKLREYWVYVNDENLLTASYEKSFENWRSRNPDEHEHAEVAERLGLFFTASGLLGSAENYLRLALELKRMIYGDNHLHTAGAIHNLAELLRVAGEFEDAEKHYHSALAILEKEREPDPAPIARVLSDLALLYHDSGHHHSALPLYQRAIELKERSSGADHPTTAESLNDLALLYQDRRDFTMAIPLYKRALDIREQRLGPNHPHTATTLNNLAGAYRGAGNLDDAEALYNRALAIQEKTIGRDHPSTLVTVANIASLLQAKKDFKESMKMYERAISSSLVRLGEGHPTVIALRISYAHSLRDSGNYEKAEETLSTTLAIATQELGETHPYVTACANNLGRVLLALRRLDEAIPMYIQAAAGWEASLGAEHPYVAEALEKLGDIYFDKDDLDTAEDYTQRSLKIRIGALGPNHKLTERARTLLALIEERRNDQDMLS